MPTGTQLPASQAFAQDELERGTDEYNLALGERRANSAKNYLISLGVAASRLTRLSYGKERPIEICSAEGCYAKNRRAVTVLAAGLSG